jgi:hypothetical protein
VTTEARASRNRGWSSAINTCIAALQTVIDDLSSIPLNPHPRAATKIIILLGAKDRHDVAEAPWQRFARAWATHDLDTSIVTNDGSGVTLKRLTISRAEVEIWAGKLA